MKTKKMKIGELKIDPKLTAIRPVNAEFVSRYRQAYRTGANFPPITIQEGTNRVISGNHRLTALLKEYPENHQISVQVKQYSNEKEVLEDFAKENVTHGNAMDGITRKRLIFALTEENADAEYISQLFNIPVKRVMTILDDVIQVTIGTSGDVEQRPAKRGFHPAKPISEKQYDEHIKAHRGIPFRQTARQLSLWLECGAVGVSEDNEIVAQELYEKLAQYLEKIKVEV